MPSVLLKELLALTAKSEPAAWLNIEKQVLQNVKTLQRNDLVTVAYHFGNQKQGSNELWTALDERVLTVFQTLTIKETEQIIDAFGNAPYQPSQQLNKQLITSMFTVGEFLANKLRESNPGFEKRVIDAFDSQLPEHLRSYNQRKNQKKGFLGSLFQFGGKTDTSGLTTQLNDKGDGLKQPLELKGDSKQFFEENKQELEQDARNIGVDWTKFFKYK